MINKDYCFRVMDDFREIRIELFVDNILFEFVGKNIFFVIVWVVFKIEEKFGFLKVVVFLSDYLIEIGEVYERVFENVERFVDKFLVMFGIKFNRFYMGYGYIKFGERIEEGGRFFGYRVDEFKEKFDFEIVKRYVESGYYWNSGMFVFLMFFFFEEVEKYVFEVLEVFEFSLSIEEVYEKVLEISIDYGVMEKIEKVVVVLFNVKWSDFGSFDVIYEVFEKDDVGNVV